MRKRTVILTAGLALTCVSSLRAATAQLAEYGIESLPDGALILEETGFTGTVLIYDLHRDRLQATDPGLADER